MTAVRSEEAPPPHGRPQAAAISVVIPHYNASATLEATVATVQSAARAEAVRIETIVVDDGSTDGHRARLDALRDQGVVVIFGERNSGRSSAVNLGAASATCDLLLILDCDCRPGSNSFFSSHLKAIAHADVSLGGLLAMEGDFWGRYQDLAVERRLGQFEAGIPFTFTTQNVLVKRSVFLAVGGYDPAYTRYGFEDRDLLIRLHESGARFNHASGSEVLHCDDRISLASVARKMYQAGKYTASRFRSRHPNAYLALGYGRLDVKLHPLLRPAGRLGGGIALRVAPTIDPWLDRMPFALGLLIARAISAMAFMGGTAAEEGKR